MTDRLTRSRTDRKIAGVCGGLAEQNDWDPTVVRLVWVAFVVFGGTGILAYILMWIIVPEAPLALPPQTGYVPVYPSTQPFYSAIPPSPDPNRPGQGPAASA